LPALGATVPRTFDDSRPCAVKLVAMATAFESLVADRADRGCWRRSLATIAGFTAKS